MPFAYFTLPNGVRIVCEKRPSKVDYFGVTINAGSRDESADCHGLAHFVEHTIFKGTEHRRAHHIINRMEAVGGELNAFTSKEETTVYSIFPHGNLTRAAELIADLIRNSVFPAKELQREKVVVKEEIDSYLDTPSEAVFDEFETLFFKGSQLEHNILGDTETLNRFTTEMCRNYIETAYTPDRIVVFYHGSMSPQRAAAVIKRYFEGLEAKPSTLRRTPPHTLPTFDERRHIDTHQAHCVMGTSIPGIYNDERIALGLLTNLLGGPGMNSRLNVALRERRGLVYSVEANMTLMSDCGLFAIYFGCDPHDVDLCRRLVDEQLHKLSSTPLTMRELNAARRQYLGQLTVSTDNREQMALNAARSTLFFNRVHSEAEVRAKLESLTPSDLLHAARHLLPATFSTLTLG